MNSHTNRTILLCMPCIYTFFFANGATAPSGPGPPHYRGFTITLRHTTLGSTPLDEWSARRRDLYMTTHNTHNRHTSMPPAGFEPTIPSSERPQTHALDRAATGIGIYIYTVETPYPRFQFSAVYRDPNILTYSLPKSTIVDFSIYVLICQRRL